MEWKYDEGTSLFYVPVRSYLCIARNSKIKPGRVKDSLGREHTIEAPVAYGPAFIVFRCEREFWDGSIALDETLTVAGGIKMDAASALRDELNEALTITMEEVEEV